MDSKDNIDSRIKKGLEKLMDKYIANPWNRGYIYRDRLVVRTNTPPIYEKYYNMMQDAFMKKRREHFRNKGCDTEDSRIILSSMNTKYIIYFRKKSTEFIIKSTLYGSMITEITDQMPTILKTIVAKLSGDYLGNLKFELNSPIVIPSSVVLNKVFNILNHEVNQYNEDVDNEILIPLLAVTIFNFENNILTIDF